MRYNFDDLSSIPLSHQEIASIASDAMARASDPDGAINHCPWDLSDNSDARYRRVVWRTIFRKHHENHARSISNLERTIPMEIAA